MSDDYSVEVSGSVVKVKGVLRLPSAEAYDAVFAPVKTKLEAGEPVELDLGDAAFMNSSGVRALATLVLLARQKSGKLTVSAKESVPWQKKTLASLKGLYAGVQLELR